ncbi:hypothetical protein CRG98_018824 [Punica granatum]|uniref:PRA1 family protein n=1 Tax=Punica granatum TaxID=22663 RepID=A0A2I0JWU1_PUNGR|nr:hypothetical protein CRG98_018824 [Punica granatum]
MDSQEIRNRPSTYTSSSVRSSEIPDPKERADIRLLCPFSVPPGPEVAAVRIVKNVAYFWLFYTLFLWTGLSISLIPKRQLSLLLLIATSAVACSYLLLLRLLPSTAVLHRLIDRRLVLTLLAILIAVELVLTKAGIHLMVTLAIGTPIIIVHAFFRGRDDLCLNEEAYNPGELFFLLERKPKEKENILSTDEV